ncbi:MAG: hypothetical protein P4M13_08550 [Alphaproteobacteria bacterium]|nr:hypothetical protein [Alphaproteobacteria bacterium]
MQIVSAIVACVTAGLSAGRSLSPAATGVDNRTNARKIDRLTAFSLFGRIGRRAGIIS